MKKLYRLSEDRKICGVCSGISEYLGTDKTLLRILATILLFPFNLFVILIYISAVFVIPQKPEID